MEQIKLIVDSINEAIGDTCKALGKKRVAKILWPEKGEEEGARYLNDCLNPERAQKLSIEQMLVIAREARDKGCDIITPFICSDVGYAPPIPIDPEDERAELQRRYIESVEEQKRINARMERLGRR